MKKFACWGGYGMAMSVMLLAMMAIAIVYAVTHGTTAAVSAALLDGADTGFKVAVGMAGVLCLWSGVTEVMRRTGLSEGLARCLGRPIRWLFPEAKHDKILGGDIAASVSANLLGLGNAATPLSIRACTRLREQAGTDIAGDSICMLVILGAGSLQLIPATVAAVRAAAGAANPFDILPAVWICTLASVTVSVGIGKLFAVRDAQRRRDVVGTRQAAPAQPPHPVTGEARLAPTRDEERVEIRDDGELP